MEEHRIENASLMQTGFLSLPPEIRNTIYDFASQTERTSAEGQDTNAVSRIHVREKTPITGGGPGLLRTCRQIRQEALGYFYCNKSFHIHPGDWTGNLCSRFWSFIHKHNFINVDVYVTPSYAEKSWHQLMAWLEKYHAGQTYPASLQGFTYPIPCLFRHHRGVNPIGIDIKSIYVPDYRVDPFQDGVVVHAFKVAADFRHGSWAALGPCIAINLRGHLKDYPGWNFDGQGDL